MICVSILSCNVVSSNFNQIEEQRKRSIKLLEKASTACVCAFLILFSLCSANSLWTKDDPYALFWWKWSRWMERKVFLVRSYCSLWQWIGRPLWFGIQLFAIRTGRVQNIAREYQFVVHRYERELILCTSSNHKKMQSYRKLQGKPDIQWRGDSLRPSMNE